jgi:hypothetical protein
MQYADNCLSCSWKRVFANALTRPFVMFAREPIIQLLGVYMAFIYGTMYRALSCFLCFSWQSNSPNVAVHQSSSPPLTQSSLNSTPSVLALRDSTISRLVLVLQALRKSTPAFSIGYTIITRRRTAERDVLNSVYASSFHLVWCQH